MQCSDGITTPEKEKTMEQKADKAIRQMEKEQKKLAHLMGYVEIDLGEQRQRNGGWK